MRRHRLAALVSATAEALLDPRTEAREATLGELKALYVRCASGTCTTDPRVARAALPYALRALGDADPEVRISGLQALELLAPHAEGSLEEIAHALADPVAAVRIAALEALGEFGPAAAPMAARVAERLKHAPTPEERAAAAGVLGNLGAQTDYLDDLVEAILHDVPSVGAEAASTLALAVEDERGERRDRIARALDAAGAIARLIQSLRDGDASTRESALIALAEIKVGVPSEPILPLLGDPNEAVRAAAAFALGKVGAAGTVPELLAAWRATATAQRNLRRQLLIALGDIGGATAIAPTLDAFARLSPELQEIVLDFIASEPGPSKHAHLRCLLDQEIPRKSRAKITKMLSRR
jgi:HEAT repeat protein